MSKLKEWENQIVCGDAYETLKQMPSEIISCVMTSFPYWGQRDYKVKGQMGLEKHYDEWLEKAWLVMDEIWRVLRKGGIEFYAEMVQGFLEIRSVGLGGKKKGGMRWHG